MDQESLIAKLNMVEGAIRHEDGLIGQRMSWLVISQSFLFGTFVALVGQRGGVVSGAAGAVRLLLLLIPLVGVLLPVVVLVAVGAAPATPSHNGAPSETGSRRCPRRSIWIGRVSGIAGR